MKLSTVRLSPDSLSPDQRPGYPASKPITIVVSYPAGGDTDAMARLFAEKLSPRLNQTVLVDNRPGAAGTVGNTYVGRAGRRLHAAVHAQPVHHRADGDEAAGRGAGYDVLNGFEPVITTAYQPLMLVANPASGIKTVPELVAAGQGGQERVYASPGAGSPMHIVGEWLNREAGVQMQHVPYRGVAPSVTDVVAGPRQHRLRDARPGVAVHAAPASWCRWPSRTPSARRWLPNVPTLAELGYKDIVSARGMGFFAPKGTPAQVVATC
jgi:tripartite-type tricarboxylate transporter receptor subunit TctC